ncbi:DUF4166 domain-containing protein [Cytobacillus purgationiresistens]|uniref:DUF4166 domain-containing protein n=1 Tax=Cytobacillus purgationiresistens TaxID=863449 RepID=A0ABU0AFE1_9BACI|nr:DUF4166 domain-containing protein [Cytobacillus purgationiresistens]MDQ0269745.1 hypothetical protein [Cytobacillus purgationiresistens]
MSIYQKALGEQFYQLHPMLQKRYLFLNQSSFQAKGTMKEVKTGSLLLKPLLHLGISRKLLFPEQGKNIQFQITNTPYLNEQGEEQIYWERVFDFENNQRFFNATMSWDSRSGIVKDYLGDPPIVYSDLHFQVKADQSLLIRSGKQRMIVGKQEISIPKWFQGIAEVEEKFQEDNDSYSIAVKVKNPLFGLIFSYEGEFKHE